MSYWKDALTEIERGKEGKNIGLPFGVPVLDNYCFGVQQKSYYLIGAETSTGKTAFADTVFILNPLLVLYDRHNKLKKGIEIENPNLDYLIDYYSYEIAASKKLIKWACFLLWYKYGIIVDYNYVISKGKNRISQEIYDKVIELTKFVEEFILMHIRFYEFPTNPTGVLKNTEAFMHTRGKIIEEDITIKNTTYKKRKYIPNNPDLIHLLIVDHVGLSKKEREKDDNKLLTKKETIDKLSSYLIHIRNFYGGSGLLISQFNRELADVNRQRFKHIQPQLNDFKDTGNPAEDAEFIFSLFNPVRYNIQEYQGYDILTYGKHVRFGFILKNRDGAADMGFGMNFCGEIGYFRNLPTYKELSINNTLSEKIINFTK